MGLGGYTDPRYGRVAKLDSERGTAAVDLDNGQHIGIPFEILKHSSELAVGQRVRVRFDTDEAVKGVELEAPPKSQVSAPPKIHRLQLPRTSAKRNQN